MKRLMPLYFTVVVAGATADERPMEHVIVTVPLHKTAAETALPITLLSGDELLRVASNTIGDTITGNPGLTNASFGPSVGRPVIRGQQGARVMVLQNSTPSADASGLSADHAVSVEPMLAQSIEILRGPSTLLYGGGAIGGVINILDNRIPDSVPEDTNGGIEYRYVSASELNGGVFKVNGGSGQWAYHLDGLYRDWSDLDIPGRAANEQDVETTDGYIANTGGDTSNITGGGSFHFDQGFGGIAVSHLENNYGIPPGAHGHHEEDEHGDEEHGDEDHDEDEHDEEEHGEEEEAEEVKLEVKQTRYDATLQLENPIQALETLRNFLTYTDYEHNEIESSGEIGTTYKRKGWDARVEAVHKKIGEFHGVFGLQASGGEFSAIGEEAFIPKTDSNTIGVFLVEDLHSGDWIFEGGLRYDWTERDPETQVTGKSSFDAFSASISALWQFTPDWQTSLALSSAERAPADEELYSNIEATNPSEWVVHAATDSIELGDDSLDTETSYNADLSLRWAKDGDYLTVTAFYNDFTDYINLVNTGTTQDEVDVYAYIQDDATFYGAELNSRFALGTLGAGDVSFGVFGDVIYGKADQGGNIPRLPPGRVGTRFDWSTSQIDLWTSILYAGDQDKPGDFERSSESYTRWDMGAEYQVGLSDNELILFMEVENILDEQIRLSTSFLRDIAPESGVSVTAGLRFLF